MKHLLLFIELPPSTFGLTMQTSRRLSTLLILVGSKNIEVALLICQELLVALLGCIYSSRPSKLTSHKFCQVFGRIFDSVPTASTTASKTSFLYAPCTKKLKTFLPKTMTKFVSAFTINITLASGQSFSF